MRRASHITPEDFHLQANPVAVARSDTSGGADVPALCVFLSVFACAGASGLSHAATAKPGATGAAPAKSAWEQLGAVWVVGGVFVPELPLGLQQGGAMPAVLTGTEFALREHRQTRWRHAPEAGCKQRPARLRKSLYGLKQAAHSWAAANDRILMSIPGMKRACEL